MVECWPAPPYGSRAITRATRSQSRARRSDASALTRSVPRPQRTRSRPPPKTEIRSFPRPAAIRSARGPPRSKSARFDPRITAAPAALEKRSRAAAVTRTTGRPMLIRLRACLKVVAQRLRAIRGAGAVRGVRRHERIAVVPRRDERLLDRPRADPPNQVPHRACLVVRPGPSRTAERLLADDGARRLIVDVEVPRGVPEPLLRLVDRRAILREDRPGEGVRVVVDEVQGLIPLALGINVGRDDRAEELLPHQP